MHLLRKLSKTKGNGEAQKNSEERAASDPINWSGLVDQRIWKWVAVKNIANKKSFLLIRFYWSIGCEGFEKENKRKGEFSMKFTWKKRKKLLCVWWRDRTRADRKIAKSNQLYWWRSWWNHREENHNEAIDRSYVEGQENKQNKKNENLEFERNNSTRRRNEPSCSHQKR